MMMIIFKNAFMTHETVLFTQGGNVPPGHKRAA